MTESQSLLIIDDDEIYCSVMQRSLSRQGLQVETASTPTRALEAMKSLQPDYVVLDLRLGADSGLELIKPLLSIRKDARIVVLTGFASLATAVHAIKLGAVDYLPKPADEQAILQAFGIAEQPQEETPEIPETPVSLKRLEWEQIQRVLKENDGNITSTAKQLGMYRRTLQRKLQKKPGKW